MSEKLESVLGQLEEIVAEVIGDVSGVGALRYYAEKILDVPGIAVVDRRAELPKMTEILLGATWEEQREVSYSQAQQDMLRAGWVKEVR